MADDATRTRLLQNLHDLRGKYEAVRGDLEQNPSLHISEQTYTVWQELCTYRPDDPPHKAVYVVAKCRVMLEQFAQAYSAVDAYHSAQRKLEEHDTRKAIENG